MAILDLDTPGSVGRSSALGRSSASLRLCLPGILIFSCVMIGVAPCSAQDVAAAARQQRTQKESEQKKSKHVYTEQDLRRARILTPKDRAQLEARKNQTAPPLAEKSQETDAQSLPPDAPLGDVARRFRRQKESQKLQQSAEFHLPFSDAVLASPKPLVMPLRPPVSTPAAPKFVPYQPPVKRSPFERPKVFMPASPRTWPSRPPGNRVAPREPAAPIAPAGPAGWHVVTVKPGDSLWKLAQQNLGKGPRWRDLLAVNPGIVDANHIAAGSQITCRRQSPPFGRHQKSWYAGAKRLQASLKPSSATRPIGPVSRTRTRRSRMPIGSTKASCSPSRPLAGHSVSESLSLFCSPDNL